MSRFRIHHVLIVVAWLATMAALVNRAYLQGSTANLATDLARYGPTAVWSGVYYRGEKIGFTVSQTTRTGDGFELQEDGRLQMLLLGQDTAATLRTTARVDTNFALRSFDFSLDPGTGPILVSGTVEPNAGRPGGDVPNPSYTLRLAITSNGVTREETRELAEAPVLTQNLSRLLASGRLLPGSEHRWTVLDPATLRSAAVVVKVGDRSVVRTGATVVPAFRVDMDYHGLQTTSWVTDTGDVVREDSPLGLMTIRETAERAQGMAVSRGVQVDLLEGSAVVPAGGRRIDEPRDVRRLRLRISGVDLSAAEMQGVGQQFDGEFLEITDLQSARPNGRETDLDRYLQPEPLIESDAPEIIAEAQKAIGTATDAAAATPTQVATATVDGVRAERLTRYVNALLDKKPTVSLPSAREVLRTQVGDCNEHTALFVAMARAVGIPARIAVGLVHMRGAFYYHAWPEVYLRDRGGRGLWLPVDPTLNQFPADVTHIRLARGGLDEQAAIVPMIGRLRIALLDIELAPNSERVLVGQPIASALAAVPLAAPRAARGCRCSGEEAGR